MAGPVLVKPQGFLDLFQQLGKRWTAKNLSTFVTSGVHAGEAPENTAMPYAVLAPISEIPAEETTDNIYYRISVEIALYVTTFEEASTLLPLVVNAFKYAPLNLSSGALLTLYERSQRYTFMRQQQYWKATQDMVAMTVRETNFSPV